MAERKSDIMINLDKEVYMKGKPVSYNDYCNSIMAEINKWNDCECEDLKWKIVPGLTNKVNSEGEYISFYGDTTVFPMDKETILKATKFQDCLWEKIPDLLAKKLKPGFFHITLHDLNNEHDSSKNRDELEIAVEETNKKVGKIFKEIRNYVENNPESRYIEVDSVGIFGGVVGLSIGFIPSSAKDYRLLMNLHNLLDEVLYLEKYLRIHLSLNYLKPIMFSTHDIKRLIEAVNDFDEKIHVKIDILDLAYQTFTDMNAYKTISTVGNTN